MWQVWFLWKHGLKWSSVGPAGVLWETIRGLRACLCPCFSPCAKKEEIPFSVCFDTQALMHPICPLHPARAHGAHWARRSPQTDIPLNPDYTMLGISPWRLLQFWACSWLWSFSASAKMILTGSYRSVLLWFLASQPLDLLFPLPGWLLPSHCPC